MSVKLNEDEVFLMDYIDSIDNKNKKDKNNDIRLNFFVAKRANQLIMAKKEIDCKKSFHYSTTSYYTIKLPHKLNDLQLNNTKDVKNYVQSEAKFLILKDNKVAEMLSTEYDDCQFLDRIVVSAEYRRCGFATKLINELISSAINRECYLLEGDVVPLDVGGFADYVEGNRKPNLINRLTTKSKEQKPYVDLSQLETIYTHLGFKVFNTKTIIKFKRISMNLLEKQLDKNLIMPNSYTSHTKNPETVILFK